MSGREIDGSVALVTGANRGLGRAITEALLERGVAKVYAAARKPEALADLGARHEGRLEVVELDVTEGDQVRAAAERAGDVQVLFNNAGVAVGGGLTDDGVLEGARLEMEVNYFAPLQLLSSFGPILAANGGGAIVNVASIAGLSSFPFYAVYGVYPGPVDTDMASEIEMEKASPADVANAILDGVESGTADIFPDPFAVGFGQQFHASPKASEEQLAAMLADA
jgi:NAD(P)-dependent dehydrogenase (short-subunit alcohol dehydrogenase family)